MTNLFRNYDCCLTHSAPLTYSVLLSTHYYSAEAAAAAAMLVQQCCAQC